MTGNNCPIRFIRRFTLPVNLSPPTLDLGVVFPLSLWAFVTPNWKKRERMDKDIKWVDELVGNPVVGFIADEGWGGLRERQQTGGGGAHL